MTLPATTCGVAKFFHSTGQICFKAAPEAFWPFWSTCLAKGNVNLPETVEN